MINNPGRGIFWLSGLEFQRFRSIQKLDLLTSSDWSCVFFAVTPPKHEQRQAGCVLFLAGLLERSVALQPFG